MTPFPEIGDTSRVQSQYPSMSRIKAVAAEVFGVSVIDIDSDRRSRRYARPRWAAIYAAKTLTPKSYPQIGREIGHRDHTTIMHAIRSIGKIMDENPDYAAQVRSVILMAGGRK